MTVAAAPVAAEAAGVGAGASAARGGAAASRSAGSRAAGRSTAGRSTGPGVSAEPSAPSEPAQVEPTSKKSSSDTLGKYSTESTVKRRLTKIAASSNSPVNTGAGFVLGILVWTWVVLPFLGVPKSVHGGKSGVEEVRNVLRAKFFNKGPDGNWIL